MEWAFFLASLILMIVLGDFVNMLKPRVSNLLFIVACIGAGSLFVQMGLIVLPFLMRQISYYSYSTQLVGPQVFYFVYFLLAVIIALVRIINSGASGRVKKTMR